MLAEKSNTGKNTDYKTLSSFSSLGWWSVPGSEWTCLVRQECQLVDEEAILIEKFSFYRSVQILAALAVLGLLGGTAITQTPVTSQTLQQNIKAVSTK